MSAKISKTNLNVPLALTLSVIPDSDILIHQLIPMLEHRGATHSIITASIIFIPIFLIYRIRAAPYFIALTQHSLVGDFAAGGRIQMFWPLTTQYYGTQMDIKSQTNVTVEWIMFIAFMIAILKTHDTTIFNKPHNSNLILAIPTFTVLLPAFLAFPMDVPLALVLPHIAYLVLFLTSILVYVWEILTGRGAKLNISRSQKTVSVLLCQQDEKDFCGERDLVETHSTILEFE